MANKEDLAQMAHLMRRAGFGATREELERYVAKGYDATVEELINPPDDMPAGDMIGLLRYMPNCLLPGGVPQPGQYNWMYNMITTKRPLEEKVALFWHQVFATGNSKVDNCDQMLQQIVMFRKCGMGNYRDLLLEISQNPAMIYWLDQNENHKREPNENWGRELLELFSLGVGNYTEKDIREAARAFTGWGTTGGQFVFNKALHDAGPKKVLGESGQLGGDDIVEHLILEAGLTSWQLLILLMVITFFLGFFLDWIEITLIVLPVFAPLVASLDFGDHIASKDIVFWFLTLMAINLQTSFLTPPFGFALFYLKGIAPKEVKIQEIYKGIIPFVLLQLCGLILVMWKPNVSLWLMKAAYDY